MCMLSRGRLCDPMDYSPPGASVHGVVQTRILEWVAISFSREFPDPGMEFPSLTFPELAGGFFTTSATWETQHRRWKCFNMILALVFSISVPMLMYLLSHCTSALQIWKLVTLCLVALLFIIFCLTVPETSSFFKSHLLKCIQGYGFRKNAGLFYI